MSNSSRCSPTVRAPTSFFVITLHRLPTATETKAPDRPESSRNRGWMESCGLSILWVAGLLYAAMALPAN